jgi:Fe2+ transport system protein B
MSCLARSGKIVCLLALIDTIARKQLNRSSVVISLNGPTEPLKLSTPAANQSSTAILYDGSIEKIWIDWNAIQPPAHKNPKQPQQVIPVIASIDDQLQQRTTKKSHTNQSPNPPKNIDKLRKIVRNIIIGAVLVAVILLIVIVFLVFVHNGKPTNVLQEISITLVGWSISQV